MGAVVACGVILAGCVVVLLNCRAWCLRAEEARHETWEDRRKAEIARDEAVGLVRAWLESEREECDGCHGYGGYHRKNGEWVMCAVCGEPDEIQDAGAVTLPGHGHETGEAGA
jgi:hypothetical protein